MTSRERSDIPSFVVIGAMKAGTTSLFEYLRQHPAIATPRVNEPAYFAQNWDRGRQWYDELFGEVAPGSRTGEASTHYSICGVHPETPARLAAASPDVRLVYLLRDPIDRMRSLYQHRLSTRIESRSFEQVLEEEPDYLDSGRYATQILRYREHFESEQMLVVGFEQLRDDADAVVGRVFRHLDLPLVDVDTSVRHNSHSGKASYGRGYRLARKAMGSAVRSRVPKHLKRRLRSAAAAGPLDPKTLLTEADRTLVAERLHDDLSGLARLVDSDVVPWLSGYLQVK